SSLLSLFFFTAPCTTDTYTLSLHDALPILALNPTKWTHHFGAFATIGAALAALVTMAVLPAATRSLRNRMLFLASEFFVLALSLDRKSTRLNSSHVSISYAVFCLKKKKINS